MSDEPAPKHWGALQRERKPQPRDDEYDRLCALVLTTAAGREWLAELRKRTIEKNIGPGQSDAFIRECVAQSRLVHEMEAGRDRWLDAQKKKNNAT